MVKEINSASEFEELIKEPAVVVDFFATWCMPCRMLSPVVDELSVEKKDVKFGKVDVDKLQEVAQRFQVSSVPTLAVFSNGKHVGDIVGYRDIAQLRADVEKLLK